MNAHLRRRLLVAQAAMLGTPLAGAGGGGGPSSSTLSGDIGLDTFIVGGTLGLDAPALALPELPLLIKSVVEVIGDAEDGNLVQTLGPAWRAVISALAQDPNALHSLSPRQLEELVAASYTEAGFEEVVLTPRSGDHGRDVIAIKRGLYKVRIIDQVKHFAPGHKVTANDVRALIGVLLSDQSATKGMVTTTSTFAPGVPADPFIAPHVPFRLELIDGTALSRRLLELGSKQGRSEA